MTEYDWIFNGLRPQWIINQDDTNWPQMTLHCIAYADDNYATPKEAIDAFRAMASLKVTNEITNSGGSDVQTSLDGETIPIFDGETNYMGALYMPQVTSSPIVENGDILFDLIFELKMVNKDILPVTPSDTASTPYNLITTGYRYRITTVNVATRFLGTFTFNWDGVGHVYIASDWLANISTDKINIDDAITVVNGDGTTLTVRYGGGAFPGEPGGNNSTSGPPLDITSLLSEGSNQLSIGIKDIYGTMLGCGPLFMVQVR